jgi:hypothetical protein
VRFGGGGAGAGAGADEATGGGAEEVVASLEVLRRLEGRTRVD